MSKIRVLAVRQPWASLIVEGLKTIEIRSVNTNIRERIAIYASLKKPTSEILTCTFSTLGRWEHYKTLGDSDREKYEYLNSLNQNDYITGYIIGTVELTNSLQIKSCCGTSNCDWVWIYKNSYAHAEMIFNDNFLWRLENPVKFSQPIPYKPPKGAVVWSKTELLEGLI